MAALVRFQSWKQTKISYEFHVGTGLVHKDQWFDVISVQCDGHELEQACKILGRTVQSRVHTFVGESAQEILANWK